jgi:hypothetical protein
VKVRNAVIFILICCSWRILPAQVDTGKNKTDSLPGKFYIVPKVNRDGESLPEIEIKEVNVFGTLRPESRFQAWRYERTVYNVKRVYPYALIVRQKLEQVNDDLKKIPDDKGRKEYLKNFEKEVFSDYEGDMRSMTITQGRILIKLIDRETENTSYDLIKEYKGSFSAVFWQAIARIFGSNLKSEYDPMGDDILIERIIYEIESGRL